MTIEYHYEMDFQIETESKYTDWVSRIIDSEKLSLGVLNFIFCNDDYLYNLNRKYLKHDTYTDIITFDYCEAENISGDIFISLERVLENAKRYEVEDSNELKRVMAHGVLHLMGYKDKNEEDIVLMRLKEEEKINMFHVEQ